MLDQDQYTISTNDWKKSYKAQPHIQPVEDNQSTLGNSSAPVARIYFEHIGKREEMSEWEKHPTEPYHWVDQPYPHLEPGE